MKSIYWVVVNFYQDTEDGIDLRREIDASSKIVFMFINQNATSMRNFFTNQAFGKNIFHSLKNEHVSRKEFLVLDQ